LKYLAPGVWRLKEIPAPTINVYLAEDVLIDAGRTWDRRRIFAELEGREISLLALTHVHPDHQGAAKAVCEARDVPLACHAEDVDAMEGRRPVQEASRSNPANRLIASIWQGPPYPVARVLAEGDEVAGFRVVHTPGALPRPRRLLPRERPRRDLRRRDPQHELRDRPPRDQGAAARLHL
jgi:glyoxylase-like metal-dependent hydrolase (beta-lactamase superfamily II)